MFKFSKYFYIGFGLISKTKKVYLISKIQKCKKILKDNSYELSIKDLEIQEEKKALKEYGSSSSGASIGDIIGAALEEGKTKTSKPNDE